MVMLSENESVPYCVRTNYKGKHILDKKYKPFKCKLEYVYILHPTVKDVLLFFTYKT